MALFEAYPVLNTWLSILSAAYLLWLAWKIATAAPLKESDGKGSPMTLLQAAAFQWVNPKAWAMGLSAITLYAPHKTLVSVLIVVSVFAVVSFPAISVWAWLGIMVRQWLTSHRRYRVFNITMALLLIASLYPVLNL
jgi:threonine/homoserine/homoserine lactone efflux protein